MDTLIDDLAKAVARSIQSWLTATNTTTADSYSAFLCRGYSTAREKFSEAVRPILESWQHEQPDGLDSLGPLMRKVEKGLGYEVRIRMFVASATNKIYGNVEGPNAKCLASFGYEDGFTNVFIALCSLLPKPQTPEPPRRKVVITDSEGESFTVFLPAGDAVVLYGETVTETGQLTED